MFCNKVFEVFVLVVVVLFGFVLFLFCYFFIVVYFSCCVLFDDNEFNYVWLINWFIHFIANIYYGSAIIR